MPFLGEVLLGIVALLATVPVGAQTRIVPDWRHLSRGRLIPSENYADQPYLTATADGAWLCVMTTGRGEEGVKGQHLIATRSTDRGHTWSTPVAIEPADGPEASYGVLLKTPSGRIYCFYNYNADRVTEVQREDKGVYTRVDSLGHYVFKFSDDGGRTWSASRYEVPVREFACDRQNVYGGKLRFFWNVGRPLIANGVAFLTLHKVGAMGQGFFAQSEGALLRSENLLTEHDPAKIRFTTLPDGDVGLRTPPGGGRISEEQCVTALSDGSLFIVYRSVDGYPVSTYSRDGGHTFRAPAYLERTPGGQLLKHPRAANFVWRCSNGKFLYWFHNHGGAAAHARPDWDPYADRNPAWICAGEERDSPQGRIIVWSQPEILLYDDDPFIRMSYPDLLEEEGRFYVTETQKNLARVHEIDPAFLNGLFSQFDNKTPATDGLLLDTRTSSPPGEIAMPALPLFQSRDTTRPDYGGKDLRVGFTLDLWLTLDRSDAGQTLLDTRTPEGRGLLLETAANGSVRLTLSDDRTTSSWISDTGQLKPKERHHLVAIVDGGPKILMFMIDGILNDGGKTRQFGWGRFSPLLRDANGARSARLSPAVERLRIYNRALRVSEAVGNRQAGP